MALRDPRNKSRNNASRRTTSATRSKRANTSAKYNPKPTSSSQRSGKNTGSQRVTQGKGGEIKSKRLKQALDGVKTKRTPAKTPPKTTKPAKSTKPTVRTNPQSSTPRGAQGPRTAPQQGPYQRPPSAVRSEVTKPKPKAPPRSATPRVSNVGPQTRQARAVQQANPGRTARTARRAATTARRTARAANVVRAAARNPGLAIVAADVATRRVADGTTKNKPNVPSGPQTRQPSANNYGNYNTMDPDGRIRSRRRVGPKIVGPKIVGPKIVGPKRRKKK